MLWEVGWDKVLNKSVAGGGLVNNCWKVLASDKELLKVVGSKAQRNVENGILITFKSNIKIIKVFGTRCAKRPIEEQICN